MLPRRGKLVVFGIGLRVGFDRSVVERVLVERLVVEWWWRTVPGWHSAVRAAWRIPLRFGVFLHHRLLSGAAAVTPAER